MPSIMNPSRVSIDPAAEYDLVLNLHRIGFVSWSDTPFTLKSGGTSRVYVNGRSELTRDPETLDKVGNLINTHAWAVFAEQRCPGMEKPCLIGIPTAGTALAVAGGINSRSFYPIATSIMREKPKDYGNSSGWVEGRPDPAHFYMTVDNVITDGASKLETIERLRADGYPTETMAHIVLVDRGQGGVEMLRERGHKVEAVFRLVDIVRAFGKYDLWSVEQVLAAEGELELVGA